MNAKLIEEEKAKEAAGETDLGRQALEDVMQVSDARSHSLAPHASGCQ